MLNNLPPVTKNLLILNILFYLISLTLAQNGVDITQKLGSHYFNSILFEPYQIITHMFMHSLTDFFHILFNMLLLVMFGAHLERIWGAKRYFFFYFACGLGAIALYNTIGVWEIFQLQETLKNTQNLIDINNKIIEVGPNVQFDYLLIDNYHKMTYSTIAGASGAIFGLLSGFALLFPNTQLQLLFPPIPIRAKYLIGGYLAFEIYNSFSRPDDQTAHLAHVGGAIVGVILILIWRKKDRKKFY